MAQQRTPDDRRARLYGHYLSALGVDPAKPRGEYIDGRRHYVRHLVARHFPRDRATRVLDLGCGYGAVVQLVREHGYKSVLGVDASPEQVQLARQLKIDGVRQGELLEFLYAQADASQDVIIAFDVLEHLTRDELIDVVDSVRRVLAPGGRWILHVPNAESPFFGRVLYGDITHELAFTSTSLKRTLFGCGFARVECYEEAPLVRNVTSFARYAVWRVVRSALRVYLAVESGGTANDAVFSQNMLAVAWTRAG